MTCGPTCQCACHDSELAVGTSFVMNPRRAWPGRRPVSRYWVYQLTDAAGAVIYVGQTSNPRSRRSDHSGRQHPDAVAMTLVQCHATRAAAVAAEAAMIAALRPAGNWGPDSMGRPR